MNPNHARGDFSTPAETELENRLREIKNNYIVGPIVRDSKVRMEQEQAVWEDLQSNTPVLIRGNWRAGKTSLTFSLANHKMGGERKVFLADVSIIKNNSSVEDFEKNLKIWVARYLAKKEEVEGGLVDRSGAIEEEMKKSGKNSIDFLEDYLERKQEKAILFFDEVIALAENPAVLKFFAEFKKRKNINVGLVLHRIAKYEDSFAEIFKEFKTYFVQPLTLEETALIMRTPLEGSQFTFSDDAIVKVRELSGGRPWEINTLCAQVLENALRLSEIKLVYTAEDFEKVSTSRLSYGGFENIRNNYQKIFKMSLSETERKLVGRLVKEGEIPVAEMAETLVKPLIDTTYVTKDESKGVYKINGQLFKRYILQNFFAEEE